MPAGVTEVMVSSRMAFCYDVDLERDVMNMSVFKNISGSDYIRVGHNTCRSSCSLTIGSNGLVDIDTQHEYTSDAIMRRIVSILMDVNALDLPYAKFPESAEDKLDFICSCIYIRIQYDSMPVSPRSLILTLCASKFDNVMDALEETSEEVDIDRCQEVLSIIGHFVRLTAAEVGHKAKLISPMCVFTYEHRIFIKNVRPRYL